MADLPDFPTAPFLRSGVHAQGITDSRLRHAITNKEVRRVLRGVYVRADVPDSIELRAAAARLVVGSHTIVCDRTAAWLHGVDVLDLRDHDIVPPLDTYALPAASRTSRRECRRGQRDLARDDICTVGGILVTTPLRTCLDLGCSLPRRRALAAMDAFRRLHGISHADMHRMLPRYFRRRGVVQLRQLVPLTNHRAESPRESWVRLEIIDAGLPWPQPQFWVTVGGEPVFRLDLAYPHAKVAIEYDGLDFHESDDQRRADEERRAWLRARGWTVIVLTKDSFTTEAIAEWTGQLRTALMRGA